VTLLQVQERAAEIAREFSKSVMAYEERVITRESARTNKHKAGQAALSLCL
jgi:hypothetical protein